MIARWLAAVAAILWLAVVPGVAPAQTITVFDTLPTPGAWLYDITAGPDTTLDNFAASRITQLYATLPFS